MSLHVQRVHRRLERLATYADLRRRARSALPRSVFDYIDGGAEGEVTMRRNVAAFERVTFEPRMGLWSAHVNLRTTVVGQPVALPILTAPCGGMRLAHPDGAIGVARAAAAAGTISVASSVSGYSMEEIAAVDGPKWFQLYRVAGRPLMEEFVHRARQAGYTALVITLDTQVGGLREKDVRNGFSLSSGKNLRTAVRMAPEVAIRPGWGLRFVRDGMPFELANTAGRRRQALPLTEMARVEAEPTSPTWDDVAWARANWPGPLLLKGIVTVADARRAVDAGADGIVVSNHGGRQLDCLPATIEVLPAIAQAVGHRIDVLVDSGIRRGSDVVKALALGATAVLAGRMVAYGLAAAGAAGVTRVLQILRSDIERTMHLLGCADIGDLDPTWIAHGPDGARRP